MLNLKDWCFASTSASDVQVEDDKNSLNSDIWGRNTLKTLELNLELNLCELEANWYEFVWSYSYVTRNWQLGLGMDLLVYVFS